jgi:hypothetical protein
MGQPLSFHNLGGNAMRFFGKELPARKKIPKVD